MESVKKKKVIIFMCRGGGAHVAAADALTSYLSDEYDVRVVDFLRDVLTSLDIFGRFTRGKYRSDDFYNSCISRNIFRKMIQSLCRFFTVLIKRLQPKVRRIAMRYLLINEPDLVISLIPFINGPLGSAADQLNIPFVLIPLDLDTQALFMHGTDVLHDKQSCYCALPFEDQFLGHRDRAEINFPSDNTRVVGFPIRPDFFEDKDVAQIKKDFDIDNDKPVVMIFMGGAGSYAAYDYVKTVAALDEPVHLIVCLGRNERLRAKLEKLSLPSHISMSVIGYTERISDLMAISDLLITKSGPTSICEALYLGVPMIIDDTNETLYWERFNIDFVAENGFGDIVHNLSEVPDLVAKYLHDPAYVRAKSNHQQSFDKKQCGQEMQQLLAHLLA